MLAVYHRYANPAAYGDQLDKLAAELVAAQPAQQEPVGSLTISHFKGLENQEFQYHATLPDGTYSLYTAPQERKPLSDEEIDAAIESVGLGNRSLLKEFARAIEAAHGITGSKT